MYVHVVIITTCRQKQLSVVALAGSPFLSFHPLPSPPFPSPPLPSPPLPSPPPPELEPEYLTEERRCVLNSTQKLAFNNYKTFIETAECTREVFKDVSL